MAIKQTAGRDALGDFAPKFAQLNDDVLFGEVWSREGELSLRDRSVETGKPNISATCPIVYMVPPDKSRIQSLT